MTDESDRPPHIGAGQVARAVGMADAIREVGSALRAAVEGEQLLLDHAPHQPVGVDCVDRVAVAALEPVGVQQG